MTPPDFIYAGLGRLVVATPGWTNDMAPASVDEYAAHLATRCPNEGAYLAAVDQVIDTWDQLGRPTVAAILAAYHKEAAKLPALPTPGNVHCDGSGWVADGDAYRPCKRCNPANYDAWINPDTNQAWRDCTPLEELVPGLRRTKGILSYEGALPPTCQPAPEPILTGDAGRRALVRAYEADCRERGIPADRLDKIVRRLSDVLDEPAPRVIPARDPTAPKERT
jgi:hypothetical protein